MEYAFRDIEARWRNEWKIRQTYRVTHLSNRPKYYVLDMFPYPSGAGLHVGHPLGYIASDIYSRYKRLKGFNVLHPMGFDSFGLPAEQYALETGQHPAETTRKNIANFKAQLDKIGFCYDWEREVQTSDPSYYRWTQWLFLQLFNSYYNTAAGAARPVSELEARFATQGNNQPTATVPAFTAAQWQAMDAAQQHDILMEYRLAYSKYGEVNWCEALGTVLANDEVINGFSERGNHPVVKRSMRQWYLRITAYADRLLEGLERVEFSESMKEMQRNWIGRSEGAEITFALQGSAEQLTVYTTRPDTIFGVDFMVLAPELDLVQRITTPEQQAAVASYLAYVNSRSEIDRMAEKRISGCFTGAYCLHPFDATRTIPIYISEYVLAGYGTGAIMAVPCGDERDFRFAQHFNIPVTNIIGAHFNGSEANPTKDAVLENSGFVNGLDMRTAMKQVVQVLETQGLGSRKVNYKMRDAGFSRQRYWGEPFPIVWNEQGAVPLPQTALPLELPHVEQYRPGPGGEGPLANIHEWIQTPEGRRETSTMPGYAGSSWYFLRFMDPHNHESFCDRSISNYWNQVDVYVGGTEHAVGHLLYSRMWTKVLYDLGFIGFDEPFKKLLNQGMITGRSFFFAVKGEGTEARIESYEPGHTHYSFVRLRYGHQFVEGDGKLLRSVYEAQVAAGKIEPAVYPINWQGTEPDAYVYVREESEKMSKSKYNVDNPDDLVEKYGADTFRMYEMFLGPVDQSKPWDTKGIEGVHRFLRKCWRLFFDEEKGAVWTTEVPNAGELKLLHKTIRKIEEDTERFSFNTAVSAFMIAVNELTELQCRKKDILQPLVVLLAPYAPHLAEELWHQLGNEGSVLDAPFPVFDERMVVETAKDYPVSVNGKVRTNILLPLDADVPAVEAAVLANEVVQKWLDGKPAKRIVFVKGKMVNVVV